VTLQSPAFRRGFFFDLPSAAAVAALLAATMLAAFAGILGLLAGLLSATLLLAGLVLATLLLLAAVALMLSRLLVLLRVLRVLTHGRSPVAQPPNRRGCRLKLTNTSNVLVELFAVAQIKIVTWHSRLIRYLSIRYDQVNT
jgi:hypothetical protein